MTEIKWRTGEPPRNGNYIVETDDGICMDYWFIYTWDDYGDKVKGWMPIEGDIEEVVRCKDCKHYEDSQCSLQEYLYHRDDDFCSWGERREDG